MCRTIQKIRGQIQINSFRQTGHYQNIYIDKEDSVRQIKTKNVIRTILIQALQRGYKNL